MSRKNNNHTGLKVFLILLILVFIAATAFVIKLSLGIVNQKPEIQTSDSVVLLPTAAEAETEEATEATTAPTEPEPEKVIATTDGKEISFIWENQNAQPEDVEPADPAQTVLYGNKKSKKFHTYDCKNLPGENNRVIFETYDEAVSAGFDPCGSCIG